MKNYNRIGVRVMKREIRGCMAETVHERKIGYIIGFEKKFLYGSNKVVDFIKILFDDKSIESLPRQAFYYNEEEKALCWDQ